MGAAVALDSTPVQVAPGEVGETEVRIRNTGQVVDRFDIDVLGDAAAWIAAEPASVNLLPGAEQTVRVRFSPPRSTAVPAGEAPYAVRVLSHEDTAGSAVVESVVVVGAFQDIVTELTPRTSRGARKGRHELAIDNAGNSRVLVDIRAVDPDRRLDFRIESGRVDTEPGMATFVAVQARPVRRFLRGPDKTLPFEVTVLPEGGEPRTVQGSMLQQAVLPKWLLMAGVVILAGAIAAFVLWQTVVKPTVATTARAAAQQETEKLADDVAAAQEQAAAAVASADEAKEAAGVGPGGPGAGAGEEPGGGAGATEAPRGPAEAAFAPSATDLRITADAAPGTPGEFVTFDTEMPEDKILWISDMVLQNPRGDAGILQIRRGDEVLFEIGLENFRDLDYHFIQPMRFTVEEPVVVAVDCRNAAPLACTPAIYFTGQELAPPTSEAPAAPAPPGG